MKHFRPARERARGLDAPENAISSVFVIMFCCEVLWGHGGGIPRHERANASDLLGAVAQAESRKLAKHCDLRHR